MVLALAGAVAGIRVAWPTSGNSSARPAEAAPAWDGNATLRRVTERDEDPEATLASWGGTPVPRWRRPGPRRARASRPSERCPGPSVPCCTFSVTLCCVTAMRWSSAPGMTQLIGIFYWVAAARSYSAAVVGRNSAAINITLFLAGLAELNLMGTLIRFLPVSGTRSARLILTIYAASASVAAVVGLCFVVLISRVEPQLGFLRSVPSSSCGSSYRSSPAPSSCCRTAPSPGYGRHPSSRWRRRLLARQAGADVPAHAAAAGGRDLSVMDGRLRDIRHSDQRLPLLPRRPSAPARAPARRRAAAPLQRHPVLPDGRLPGRLLHAGLHHRAPAADHRPAGPGCSRSLCPGLDHRLFAVPGQPEHGIVPDGRDGRRPVSNPRSLHPVHHAPGQAPRPGRGPDRRHRSRTYS